MSIYNKEIRPIEKYHYFVEFARMYQKIIIEIFDCISIRDCIHQLFNVLISQSTLSPIHDLFSNFDRPISTQQS